MVAPVLTSTKVIARQSHKILISTSENGAGHRVFKIFGSIGARLSVSGALH